MNKIARFFDIYITLAARNKQRVLNGNVSDSI